MTSFDHQPILHGARIMLRPLRADDYAALYDVASDPGIWEQHPASNRHEPEVFREFFDESIQSGETLVVIDIDTRLIIGSSRFHGFNKSKDEVEIGWTFLSRAYWGGVTNNQLKELMLKHAFKFVSNVVLLVGPGNIRSQRAVEKIGGVASGSRPDDTGLESVEYIVTASTFRKLNKAD